MPSPHIMGVLRAALAVVGLAPAAHLNRVSGRVEAAEQRAAESKRALGELREEVGRWKKKAEEFEKRLAKAEEAAQRLPKAEREMQQWKARDEKHLGQLAEVRERMERAERAVALSREHLMATETKLDIVEGAIGVLDARTRAALQATASAPAEAQPSGAAVEPGASLPARR
jgi:predicted  nucleic acid-binding Zn-ribbon protein